MRFQRMTFDDAKKRVCAFLNNLRRTNMVDLIKRHIHRPLEAVEPTNQAQDALGTEAVEPTNQAQDALGTRARRDG